MGTVVVPSTSQEIGNESCTTFSSNATSGTFEVMLTGNSMIHLRLQLYHSLFQIRGWHTNGPEHEEEYSDREGNEYLVDLLNDSLTVTFLLFSLKGILLSMAFVVGTEMHLINQENNSYIMQAATLFTLAIIAAAGMGSAPAAASSATATTTLSPQPVTATTDNQSVNVLISWEPAEIEPGEETAFTLDFQDPSSGDSIPHVNYNFEIIDQNGNPVASMTDLHTHSGSDEQTVTFDNPGSFNLVATIIGTGIDPPFDTIQSGTAQTVIPVGQQLAGATGGNNTAGTTTSSPETGMIELSPEPVYQERQIRESRTAINQTHFQVAISGNGTLTLPNTTETISTTSTGSVLSALDGTATGKEVITTEDGSESATATTYGIARLEARRGIMIALFDTNSTGILAPLDGMILAGQIEYPPEETHSLITLWEWQSGIPLPPPPLPPTTMEEPPLMNTTTTMTTNATTAADTNATAASEEEVVEEEAVGGVQVAE
jgi:hypothetical protein